MLLIIKWPLQKTLRFSFSVLLILVTPNLFLLSCTQQNVVLNQTPTMEATKAPQEIITVMTYNILNGGEERIPRILEVIKEVDPDILGIQEAKGWKTNNEAIAQEVAPIRDAISGY